MRTGAPDSGPHLNQESPGRICGGRDFTIDIEDSASMNRRGELSWPWTLSREGCNCRTLTVDM